MDNLRLLYLSYNQLREVPANLPPNVIELRFHENNINKIQKDAFRGLTKLHVLGIFLKRINFSRIPVFDCLKIFA